MILIDARRVIAYTVDFSLPRGITAARASGAPGPPRGPREIYRDLSGVRVMVRVCGLSVMDCGSGDSLAADRGARAGGSLRAARRCPGRGLISTDLYCICTQYTTRHRPPSSTHHRQHRATEASGFRLFSAPRLQNRTATCETPSRGPWTESLGSVRTSCTHAPLACAYLSRYPSELSHSLSRQPVTSVGHRNWPGNIAAALSSAATRARGVRNWAAFGVDECACWVPRTPAFALVARGVGESE